MLEHELKQLYIELIFWMDRINYGVMGIYLINWMLTRLIAWAQYGFQKVHK